MAQTGPRSNHSEADTDEQPSESVEAVLEEVSQRLNPAECENLTELGIYSIHDHVTARTITLPEGAEEFSDTTTVKQFYFEGEECPILIVAPLQI
jgi:hypothetical protein